MKRILPIIIIVIIIVAGWFFLFKKDKKSTVTAKTEAVAVKKYSAEFDSQITTLIESYMAMKNAFVEGDTSAIKAKTGNFIIVADSLNMNELHEKDSSVYLAVKQNVSDIKANASPILEENDLTEMRHDFSMVSENLYPLLKTVGYEGEKLYWQNCPMAFGDDKPANWLSNTSEINNPYLGKNDPKYKSGMLHCGENMDSIYLK